MHWPGRNVFALVRFPDVTSVVGTVIALALAVRRPAVFSLKTPGRKCFGTASTTRHNKKNWDVQVTGGTERPVLRSEDSPAGVNRLYFDNRQGASLKLRGRHTFGLSPQVQYTLTARLRMKGYYGEIRVDLVDAADNDRESRACRFDPTHSPSMRIGLAGERARSIAQLFTMPSSHQEFVDLSIVFFAPAKSTQAFLEIASSGGIETLVEDVAVYRNMTPVSTCNTGIGIKRSRWFGDTFFRVGRLFEAEAVAVNPQVTTSNDIDGDGQWSLIRLPEPDHPKIVPTENPWLFSEYTVLKSDSRSRDAGGMTGVLKLHCTSLYSGRYEVFLSDTYRDAAISFNGRQWQTVRGGQGEVNLGLVDVREDGFRLWIDHRHVTSENPGPLYVDYVCFMPVYVPNGGLEQPVAPQTLPEPAALNETNITLVSAHGAGRQDEWVWCGVPFAPGQFRHGDGVACDGVKNLSAQPVLYWRDGSVKWLAVEFQTDCPFEKQTVLALRWGQDVSSPATPQKAGRSVGRGAILHLGNVEVRAADNI